MTTPDKHPDALTPPQSTASPAPASSDAADSLFDSARRSEEEQLVLTLGSYEGPLDMLLDLARRQKVDLREISVLALAEQYLSFVEEAKRLRLDLAADYLVMAAWLAYLKSRLLLPKPPEDDGPSHEEMAEYLRFQLQRLEGVRSVAAQLMARDQLGRAFFARGEAERRVVSTKVAWTATTLDLLRAYARQRTRENFTPLHYDRRAIVAIDEALSRLRRSLGDAVDWRRLESYLPREWRDDAFARSAIASTFAATLELAKHGQVYVRQEGAFSPLMVRPRRDVEEQEARVLAELDARDRPASERSEGAD